MPRDRVRVGTLDDPVWGEPPEAATTRRHTRVPMPRSRLLVLGTLVVALGLAVSLVLLQQPSRSGGDPGGRTLQALEPAASAVPTGSADVVTQSTDSVWSPKCPDNPGGQAGWSEVSVDTTFTTALSTEQVVTTVSSVLVRHGWDRHDESFGPGQGVVAHWTKRLASGPPAEAAVYPVPAGSTRWILTVASKPQGFALPGC